MAGRRLRTNEVKTSGGIWTTLALAGVILMPASGQANPAMARMTGQTCSYCHVPAQEPELNARGRDFKDCGFRFCGGSHSQSDDNGTGWNEGGGHACSARFTCKFGESPRCYYRISDHEGGGARDLVIPAGEARTVYGLHRGAIYCFSRQPFGEGVAAGLDCVLGMKEVRMSCQ
jgi:hypothetical protein